MNSRRVVCRLRGGLGNQLFCYSAARRLALVNSAEMVLDDATGFRRDHTYRRKCALDHFAITARRATPGERLEPFERWRRALWKGLSRLRRFENRTYVVQELRDYDPRLLSFRVRTTTYLDGLWQSERYFKDVSPTIREDLRIRAPEDSYNRRMLESIRQTNAVSVHIRWFDSPGEVRGHNAPIDYYARACRSIGEVVPECHYFLFSDNPEAAAAALQLRAAQVTLMDGNRGQGMEYADLLLMSKCRHHVIANSTFSWWGAWLGENPAKHVIAPAMNLNGITAWGFDGLIPDEWTTL